MTYLQSAVKEFRYYKQLAEKAIAQTPDDKLHWQFNEESNSIVTIVQHMSGNMHSRWTDIFNTDGEKDWRDRDAEFVGKALTRVELMQIWDEGWRVLFTTLEGLTEADLQRIVHIRQEPHTLVQAINRQLAHYPYHVGQIVMIGKMWAEEWRSLSIPRKNNPSSRTQ